MPPDIEYTLLLDSLEATSFSAKPHWLRFIAAHRAVCSVSPVPMRVCESAYAKYVFAREHDPMLAMLVKLSVGLDAELDPRLFAREHHDAEPWYYRFSLDLSGKVFTDSDTFSNDRVVLMDALFENEWVASDAWWQPLSELQKMFWVAVLWLLDHWSYACHTEWPIATRRRSSIDAETSRRSTRVCSRVMISSQHRMPYIYIYIYVVPGSQ